MSELYGTTHISSVEEVANDDRLMGMFIVDDVLRGTQGDIKKFC
jgi:hypothetical protein